MLAAFRDVFRDCSVQRVWDVESKSRWPLMISQRCIVFMIFIMVFLHHLVPFVSKVQEQPVQDMCFIHNLAWQVEKLLDLLHFCRHDLDQVSTLFCRLALQCSWRRGASHPQTKPKWQQMRQQIITQLVHTCARPIFLYRILHACTQKTILKRFSSHVCWLCACALYGHWLSPTLPFDFPQSENLWTAISK